MSLKYRPLAIGGFTVLTVLFLSVFIASDVSTVSFIAGALLFIISVIVNPVRKRVFPFFVAAALLCGGMLALKNEYSLAIADIIVKNKECDIKGVITDYPTYSDSRYYYKLKLQNVDGTDLNMNLRLSLSEPLEAEPYDTVEAHITPYLPGSSAGKDVEHYFQSKNLILGGYISDDADAPVVTSAQKRPFRYNILKIRQNAEKRILNKLPNENGGTVIALLLGDKSHISDELNHKLSLAGIAPVFAVSGLHLSIWVMGLYSLLEQLKVRRKFNSIIGIAFTLFFMMLTGFTPSVCRSGLMMILLLAGNLFNRKSDSVNSLGFAALILCIVNPFIAADTGFLMSFTATLGIVTLYPVINRHLLSKIEFKPLKALLAAISVSVIAIVSSLPVTVFFIEFLSLFSVISNLLVTFAASVCMLFGGLTAVLFPIKALSDITALIAGLTAKYIIFIIEKINDFPVTAISTADIFWKCGIVFGVAVVLFAVVFLNKRKTAFVSFGLSVVIAVTSICSVYYYRGLTRISVMNVGSGICVVMTNGNKKILLTNGGKSYNAYYNIEDELNSISRRDPDMMLIADGDGAENNVTLTTLKNFDFRNVVLPCISRSVNSIVEDRMTVANETKVSLWQNAELEFHAEEKCSYCYVTVDSVTLFIIFDSYRKSEFDEKFLDADFLICDRYIPGSIDVSRFGRVIISAYENSGKSIAKYVNSQGGQTACTYELGNIYINVKNSKYKIHIKEG